MAALFSWHELVNDWPVWVITVPGVAALFGVPLVSAIRNILSRRDD